MENKFSKKAEYVIAAIVLIYAVALMARIVMAADSSADYPNEYREAANIAMTRSISEGVNIYSYDTLKSETPPVCYLYGPLMSVTAAAISKLFPSLTLWSIHYGISIVSIAVSALLLALMVKGYTHTLIAPVTALALGIFCHWRYGYAYGAPDSFGLLLMMSVLFLLLKGAERSRAESFELYIEGAALLTLASFFTKQYFLMVAATGALYLLVISRRLFVRYAASGIVFSIITFALLKLKCPLYLTYAIYFLKGPGPGAAMGKTGKSYNNMQVSYLGGMLLLLFAAAAALLLYMAAGCIRTLKKEGIRRCAGELLFTGDREFIFLFLIQAAVSALVLRYIGNNDGAFLSYYLQLFTPALSALSVYAVERSGAVIEKRQLSKWIFIGIYALFLGYTVYKVEPRLVIGALSDEEKAAWEEAYELLDEYSPQGDIYYTPLLNYYAYTKGHYVYNDGQPFVFTRKFLKSYNESDAAKKLFPMAGRVIAKHLDFRETLRARVINGEYALVARVDGKDEVFTTDELELCYKKADTLLLRAGSWAWEVELWTKK